MCECTFPNVGLFDINGCDAVSDECERMVKLFKKFKPNDGLLDDCCCCSCGGGGGSNGEEGRLDPDEFIGGVELLDLDDNVLRFDGAASLPIIFDELSGISNFYDPSLKEKKGNVESRFC